MKKIEGLENSTPERDQEFRDQVARALKGIDDKEKRSEVHDEITGMIDDVTGVSYRMKGVGEISKKAQENIQSGQRAIPDSFKHRTLLKDGSLEITFNPTRETYEGFVQGLGLLRIHCYPIGKQSGEEGDCEAGLFDISRIDYENDYDDDEGDETDSAVDRFNKYGAQFTRNSRGDLEWQMPITEESMPLLIESFGGRDKLNETLSAMINDSKKIEEDSWRETKRRSGEILLKDEERTFSAWIGGERNSELHAGIFRILDEVQEKERGRGEGGVRVGVNLPDNLRGKLRVGDVLLEESEKGGRSRKYTVVAIDSRPLYEQITMANAD